MKKNRKTNGSSVGQRIFLIMSILLIVISLSMFAGCGGSSSSDDSDDDSSTGSTTGTPDSTTSTESSWSTFDISSLEDDYDSNDYDVPGTAIGPITFSGSSITGATGGASASGAVLTISQAGTYEITGSSTVGRIIVDTEDEAVVRLIFNELNLSCADRAPFYVANAERTAIILADGSTNTLADNYTTSWVFDDEEDEQPNATLHSRDYITIGVPNGGSGTGSLTVNANYNDGITGKDGLIINGGTITVNAPDDGIRGKDYLIVLAGDITVNTTDGDGLLSDNDSDTTRGYISIEGDTVDITSGGDGIQAETYVIVSGGDVDIESGGGYGSSFDELNESKKGIKGVVGVLIEAGVYNINSADDAVHSNDFVVVYDGTFILASGDDGMHADLFLKIFDGSYDITDSYEGIEGYILTIVDGDFRIVSDDDALNAAGGADGSGFTGGRDGGMPSTGTGYLYINGGNLFVDADGDGLDSNGNIEMTGGTVLVHGPAANMDMNGALDSGDTGGEININGGFLVAVGSSGMAEAPDTTSAQYSVLLNFDEESAGSPIRIETSAGDEVLTFVPVKSYESIVLSSSDLANGTTYNVYLGGSTTGTSFDILGLSTGLYTGGGNTGGTLDTELGFTISSMVTTVGDAGGMSPSP